MIGDYHESGDLYMNDFEKAMFIFFDEWGGSPHFQAECDELFFLGVDLDDLSLGSGWELAHGDLKLINQLYDLGWMLTEDGNAFVSYRWGSC